MLPQRIWSYGFHFAHLAQGQPSTITVSSLSQWLPSKLIPLTSHPNIFPGRLQASKQIWPTEEVPYGISNPSWSHKVQGNSEHQQLC